jgi:hypothetical protein
VQRVSWAGILPSCRMTASGIGHPAICWTSGLTKENLHQTENYFDQWLSNCQSRLNGQ